MDLKHFSHEHALKFIEYKSPASKEARCSRTNEDPADEKKSYAGAEEEEDETRCFGCSERLEGPSYCCKDNCKFYLHKSCAELELAPEINHSLHPSHPLNFLAKSPYDDDIENSCNFCHGVIFGFVYHCALCNFDLDVKCAFLQPSENFHKLEHSMHMHPLILNEKYNKEEDACCKGCGEELSSGPIYRCLYCIGDDSFDLHKECAELAPEIKHPLHPSHPLNLLAEAPYDDDIENSCNLCHGVIFGFVYHCALCNFDLDVKCAFLQPSENFHKLEHSMHMHPLIFNEKYNKEEDACCKRCGEELSSGPIYRCLYCTGDDSFDLHKECAELKLALRIKHPLHPSHSLVLRSKSIYANRVHKCSFCGGNCFGFIYYCYSCDFCLDVECSLLQSSENFHELEHSLHKHPLIFNEKYNKREDDYCMVCGEDLLSSPIYRCLDCRRHDGFDLHKECAKLELALEINHPLHPSHPLNLQVEEPYVDECRFCGGDCFGFVYSCALCDFHLDVKCALLQSSETFHKLEHSLHKHPLILNEKYNKKEDAYCMRCGKELSLGPIYRCLDCSGDDSFDLHKECAELELALEINHPYHRKHPLTLLSAPPDHRDRCSCSLCGKDWKGFVYYCSFCRFGLTLEEVLPPNLTIAASHQHQWTLLSRFMPFTCDFCGTDGDFNPYLCTCNLVLHKDCKALPHAIRITRHHHLISHIYSLQRNEIESNECRICFHEVNGEYGCYSCSAPACNYIAHAKCATRKDIWDGTTASDDEDGAPLDSTNLITAVFKEINEGEDVIATEINHAYHEHNLILTPSGDVKADDACDGCRRAISSTPFYSCQQCLFLLHKDCAKLPRQIRSPLHKHVLTLFNCYSGEDDYSICSVCHQRHSGFIYRCRKSSCDFDIDIQCSLLSDTLKHPSHDHLLFLDHKDDFQDCSGCFESSKVLYRCTKHCGFALDLRCITLPRTAWFKYDKHPLTLTIDNRPDPSQLYCDLCEEERHPDHCFYYCEDCDNTVHPQCVLGDFPFVKPGSTVKFYDHSFAAVSMIWNCRPCKVCGELCNGQVFECQKCNLVIHWGCRSGLGLYVRVTCF